MHSPGGLRRFAPEPTLRSPAKCRGWRARRLHPKALLCGRTGNGRVQRARPATCRHPFRSPDAWPSLRPVGSARTKAPLRCATRTAGRNAGGFPGRHPGTAAGPSVTIARDKRIPPARAPITSRSDRRRIRDAAPRQEGTGARIIQDARAGISGEVMPGWNDAGLDHQLAAPTPSPQAISARVTTAAPVTPRTESRRRVPRRRTGPRRRDCGRRRRPFPSASSGRNRHPGRRPARPRSARREA